MPEGSYSTGLTHAVLTVSRSGMRAWFLALAFAMFASCSAVADSLVVFDGGSVSGGEGFALPSGISKFEVSRQNPFRNAEHLDYDLKISDGWAGGGWNWRSWEGDGDDISGFSELSFRIRLNTLMLKDLTFQLTSRERGSHDGMGRKVSVLALIMKRGEYVEVRIPVSSLLGGTLDERAVWGFNVGVFPQADSRSEDCRIQIDMIEFRR
ncbi:MAG: hypothetical protein JW808_06930 [Victivallales bacterium]|nr:hypothetical protein [Victivallales bacterium]